MNDFYQHVPKDPASNVDWRQWMLARCWQDPKLAEEAWIACSRDILFYINAFGWLLEPRDKPVWLAERPWGNAKEIPFITRPYQDETFLRMAEKLGKKDMLILKSREMGATWMVLYLFDWDWRFHDQSHFGLVSKDEDSVDSTDNPDSLMAKLDFIDAHLPHFLQPGGSSLKFRGRNRSDHTISNLANGSTIAGYSCTANMGRGGRKKAFYKDEMHAWPAGDDTAAMASTQHVTNCRILCSTPNPQRGQSGEFYDIVQRTEADIERIVLRWSMDQDKARGLYRSKSGTLEIADKLFPYTKDYPFILDDKERSPYYDYECRRAGATPRLIAAELDMDFGGATNRLFDPVVIQMALGRCSNESFRADLRQDHGVWLPVVTEAEKGPLQIWVPGHMPIRMDESGNVKIPPGRRFAIGADVSRGVAGAFSSYSAAVIIDIQSGDQIGEWRSNRVKPVEYGEFLFFLGRAFNHALINPEITGPGLETIARLIEMGYPNLWFPPKQKNAILSSMSTKPGYDNKDGGFAALGELQDAMKKGLIHIFSRQIVAECERYFMDEDGKLRHPLVGRGRIDAPEKSHGDSAIACAMAWWAIKLQSEEISIVREPEIPMGSFAWRRQQYADTRKKQCAYWSPLEEMA